MKSLSTQVIFGAGVAILAVILSASVGSLSAVIGLASASLVAGVAFAAQMANLRERQRLVYRPVYVRNETVQRRVMSRD